MARIDGVRQADAGLKTELVYRLGPRMVKKLTGREPRTGSGIQPMEIWADQLQMMFGMGKFNQAVRNGKSVDERVKNLVELKGAQMIGCEFCVDLGSQICRNSGVTDEELLALPHYRRSDLFTEREKLALDYAVGMMRTPVEVTDELFARMKEHFSDEQLVEITALLTVVNLDRFNAAFGIGSAARRPRTRRRQLPLRTSRSVHRPGLTFISRLRRPRWWTKLTRLPLRPARLGSAADRTHPRQVNALSSPWQHTCIHAVSRRVPPGLG
jgi:AhpD family alkylhydroperoxidase